MTLQFSLSKVLETILRLWGIDRAAPRAQPKSFLDEYLMVAVTRSRRRGQIQIPISRDGRKPRQ